MGVVELFAALVAGHAICDYPLQGDFLARAKNRVAPIPGVPWYQAMGAHSIIHGGAVMLLTGIPLLGVAEGAVHALTDDAKCAGKIGFNADQSIHIACKLAWAIIAGAML